MVLMYLSYVEDIVNAEFILLLIFWIKSVNDVTFIEKKLYCFWGLFGCRQKNKEKSDKFLSLSSCWEKIRLR